MTTLEDEINIKNLVIEDPKLPKDEPFNPQTDTPNGLMDSLKTPISGLVTLMSPSEGSASYALNAAKLIGFLSADQKEWLGIDHRLQQTATRMVQTTSRQNLDQFFTRAAQYRLLFPHAEMPVQLDSETFERWRQRIEVLKPDLENPNNITREYCNDLIKAYILYPQKYSELKLKPDQEQTLRQILYSRLKFHDPEVPKHDIEIYTISFVLAALKLFSDHPEKINLQDVDLMRQNLVRGVFSSNRSEDIAFNLMALQADVVEVTSRGVKFIHHQSEKSEPLPAARSF